VQVLEEALLNAEAESLEAEKMVAEGVELAK
jgi:hypothetical protein